MSSELTNFLFEIGNFGLLVVGLAWLVLRPIRTALDAERERRDAVEAELATKRTELETAQSQLEEARHAFELDMNTTRGARLAAAQSEAAAIVERAREQAEREREAALRDADVEAKARIDASRTAMGTIAGAAVRQLLETVDGPPLEEALVGAVCERIAEWGDAELGDIVVEAARPLSAEAVRRLSERLRREVSVRVVAELGAGVRITSAAGQIDATAAAFARLAEGRVVAELSREGDSDA